MDSITIGRPKPGWRIDLDLSPDVGVSRPHACLGCEEGVYWIEDLKSKHGTFVNGQRITGKTCLKPGDRIQLGNTTLEIPGKSDSPFSPLPVDDQGPVEGGLVTHKATLAEASPDLLLSPEMARQSPLEAFRRRLTAICDLGTAVCTCQTIETLAEAIVKYLLQAIPGAARGGFLLQKGHDLLLKAHLPEACPSVSMNLAARSLELREGIIWQGSPAPGLVIDPTQSIVRHNTQCAMYAPLVWQGETLGVVYVDNTEGSVSFEQDDLRLMLAIGSQAAMFVKNRALLQELVRQETVRSSLLGQFPPKVVEEFLKHGGRPQLRGERREATVLVSDVRGFTRLSAALQPEGVVKLLNDMFYELAPIVLKYGGMIDKYVGDGMLAVFGSPEEDPQQSQNAVRAALDMQAVMLKLADTRWQPQDLPVLKIGIGIHRGEVVQGFIGSRQRMEYTVIGDTVNRASRYCDGADGAEILVSPEVFAYVHGMVAARLKTIPSKHEGDMKAYVVLGPATPDRPA
ncbi:MAG: adenylate/guanylate cyclase domain-containing protein [Thermodesulfobacteriota bacterium]